MVVTDRIDGWWNEELEHRECAANARFAVCCWIHTKAVEVQGGTRQLRKEALMQNMNRLGMQEAELHEWVTEFALFLHEHNHWRAWGHDSGTSREKFDLITKIGPCKPRILGPSLEETHTATSARFQRQLALHLRACGDQ